MPSTGSDRSKAFVGDRPARRIALRITLIYLALGALWILLSDQVMAALFSDPDMLVRLSMYRGWFYVGITALFLYLLMHRDLAALLHGKRALRRFKITLECVGDAVIATDRHGMVEFMNPVAETLTGWSAGEALGRAVEEIFPIINETTKNKVDNPVRLVLAKGIVVGLANHTLLVARDGTLLPIADSGAPIVDDQGQITGVVLVFRDISRERETALALEASESKYRLLIEYARDWVFWLDPEGRHLYDSPSCSALTGYEPGELQSNPDLFTSIIHAEDRARYQEHVGNLHADTEHPLEFRIIHREGRVRWLTHRCWPLHDDQGNFLGRRGSNRDITGQKEAELALQEHRALLQAVIEGSSDAVYVKDLHGRYLLCNRAVAGFLGKTEKEILGQTDADLFPPDLAGQMRDRDLQTLEGVRQTYEQRLTMPDGHRYDFLITKGPLFDAQGRASGLFGISRDISALSGSVRQYARLNRTLNALRHGNQVLLHAEDETGLLDSLCRIVVEDCGHAMVWIGLAENDAEKTVRPVAWAGCDQAYVESLRITWADGERGQGPTGRAIRTGNPVVSNDIVHDPAYQPWRQKAMSMGFGSSLALPLSSDGQTLGALNIYSLEADGFPADEITLLSELAGNLAFGITALRIRADHRQSVEALRQSEGLLQSIWQAAPIGIGVAVDRIIKQCNPAMAEITGYKPQELLNQSTRLIYPDDQEYERVGRVKYQQIQAHGIGHVMTRWRCKDGQIHAIFLSSSPIDQEDLSQGVVFTAQDLSELEQAEHALREGETRYRWLIDNTAEGFWMINAERQTIDVNQSLCTMLGYTREEMLGRLPTEFADEANQKIFLQQMARIPFTVHRFYEIELLRKDGSSIPLYFQATTLPGERHDRSSFAFITDLRERKQTEEENRRLFQAMEQSTNCVLITDPAGRIQYVNPACEQLTGYQAGEVGGRLASEIQPPLAESRQQGFWQNIGLDQSWKGNGAFTNRDGQTCQVAATISPVRDQIGRITNYISVQQDISREKELQAQLEQAQKMESVGRLAGGVAHDFNNKLGIILGNVELALLNPRIDPKLRKDLEVIATAANQSADLTRQLLAFARKQTVAPKVLDLNQTIATMLKLLQRLIGEDINLIWLPAPTVDPVLLDPTQMDQILANLTVNARDAVHGVGTLTIETANVAIDHQYCANHSEAEPGDYVMLVVSDTGQGMDREVQHRIFEPFFTTKTLGKGTGLGLSTVYGIVKQNRGFINVYSEPGHGTAFKIYFPRHTEVAAEVSHNHGARNLPRGMETILLVEDEGDLRDLSRNMLSTLGYTVLVTEGPNEALALVHAHRGKIDLLFSDVILPVMNGRDLASMITHLQPGIRILYMSGYTADVIGHHGVLEEGVHFLPKPYTLSELAEKVRQVLDQPGAEHSCS